MHVHSSHFIYLTSVFNSSAYYMLHPMSNLTQSLTSYIRGQFL
nr:MAG TPA: hypothetical protein [Caudoviricetes sp.]